MTVTFAIAGPILARNTDEADLLVQSVEQLAEHGPVILADGGSVDGFTGRLSRIAGVEVSPTPGAGPRLVAQVRQALTMAADRGATTVLYTEPDKRWFFENRLSDFLSSTGNDGVCLPARDAPSFSTFPQGQQTPERLFNALAGETLGIETDFLYGPLLLPAKLIPFLSEVPLTLAGDGARIF
jgi:hypothetical protein